MKDDFAAILTALPEPSQWSCESIRDGLRDSAGIADVDDRDGPESGHVYVLLSGFTICVSPEVFGLSIHWPSRDFDQTSAMADMARTYALERGLSLELYFFPDANSAMVGFGSLDVLPMVADGFDSPAPMSLDGIPYQETDIVARRQLERDGRVFEVVIGRPRRVETGNYACSWSLIDDTGQAVFALRTYGEDSAQALTFALLAIGDRVEAESDGFTHAGLPGSGFPRHFDWRTIGVDPPFLPHPRLGDLQAAQ